MADDSNPYLKKYLGSGRLQPTHEDAIKTIVDAIRGESGLVPNDLAGLEEVITRAVARGLASAAATSVETNRDLWLRFYTGAAPFVTRMGVLPFGPTVRLSFGEQFDAEAPTQFRAAVVMTDYSAWELWKLIGNLPGVQHWEEESKKEPPPTEQDDGGQHD